MQITHIRIQNILGIAQLEVTPGAFNTISGKNGSGKTSVLEAIKAVVKGGHDATLLRKGAEKGEVVLVLDDGTEVRKRVSAGASTTDVTKDRKKVQKPADAIRALTDMLSVNPVDFLSAAPKDRVRVLLETLPIALDAERLKVMTGFHVEPRPGVHALTIIDEVHKKVYDARTGTNRVVKEKSGTINQLRQALPPESTGAAGDEASLTAKLKEIDATRDAENKRIGDKIDGLRKARDDANDERRNKIDALRQQIATVQGEIVTEDTAFIEWEGKANTQKQKVATRHMNDSAPVRASLQRINDDREAYARRQQTLETIATHETELEGLEAEAATQTDQLAAIDAYKLELLESLPIAGLEVREGELFRDGVPFDRLNTAQQVDIAVELAKVRAGELGVICVDRIEALDPQTFDSFRDRAIESGLQMFVTRVSGDEFAIESEA